jgi:hypothetical protein
MPSISEPKAPFAALSAHTVCQPASRQHAASPDLFLEENVLAKIPQVLHEHINTAYPANVCLIRTMLPNGFAKITPRGSTIVLMTRTSRCGSAAGERRRRI